MSNDGPVSWFTVTTDDQNIHLAVRPPGRDPWVADIPWDSIIRVCFAAEGPLISDGLYIYTNLRPESWAVPAEAAGGSHLLDELVSRGLFDANVLTMALLATHGLFCWPPATGASSP